MTWNFEGSFLVLFAFLVLCLWNLSYPETFNFDEFHYVPAAREYVSWGTLKNLEHPPLSKVLISLGIRVFGDNPIGWRLPSVLAGLIALGSLALLINTQKTFLKNFEKKNLSFWILFFVVCQQSLLVQARIATPDIFMMCFCSASFYFFLSFQKSYRLKDLVLFCGVSALALSSKWASIFQILFLTGLLFLPRICFDKENPVLLSSKKAVLRGFTGYAWKTLAALGLIYFFYCLTFLPLTLFRENAISFKDIPFRLQIQMYELQKSVGGEHPYSSQLWDWVLLRRPIWYHYDPHSIPQSFRGVLLIANPFLTWIVFPISLLIFLRTSFQNFKVFKVKGLRILENPIFQLSALGFGLYLLWTFCWILVPRQISFYYYYFPATVFQGFFCATVLFQIRKGFRWSLFIFTGLFFLFFLPLLVGLPMPTRHFQIWMILKSWI